MTLKSIIGCYKGACFTNGRFYDMETVTGLVRWRVRNRLDQLKRWPHNFRYWTLAGWFSYLAVKCRGERWYVADTWHGVPGNRVSELKQEIWQQVVLGVEDADDFEVLRPKLDELAQLANENWGHIWPKEEKK